MINELTVQSSCTCWLSSGQGTGVAGAELGMVSKGFTFNPEQGQCFGQLMQKLSEAVVSANL